MSSNINKDVKKYNTFQTPILFLIFNRPELTKQVFAEIKKIKPKKLYISADGPRENNEIDKYKCEEARNIIKDINWDCELKTLFREENWGCHQAVSSAITWFFKDVEQGIILEDDCLPDQSFFFYCQELLHKYKDNSKVFNISGSIYQNEIESVKESYFFSKYFNCWGWASWANRWNNNFDIEMTKYTKASKKQRLKNLFTLAIEDNLWLNTFRRVHDYKIDSWDHAWVYNSFNNQGLTCLPQNNLIKNIGIGEEATHTNKLLDNTDHLQRKSIDFPLLHPSEIALNKKADKENNKAYFKLNFKIRIIFFFKELIRIILL